MPELEESLEASVSEALETMFFTCIEPLEPGSAAENTMCAAVDFKGSPSGRLELALPDCCAQALAASFLGVDEAELDSSQTGEVICEFANVLCGSVLSRVNPNGLFELFPPAIQPPHPLDLPVRQTFGLPWGPLEVGLLLVQTMP